MAEAAKLALWNRFYVIMMITIPMQRHSFRLSKPPNKALQWSRVSASALRLQVSRFVCSGEPKGGQLAAAGYSQYEEEEGRFLIGRSLMQLAQVSAN